jgi:hypothetical protein
MNTLIGSHQLTKGLTYRLEGPEPIDNIVYYSGVHDPSGKYRALNLAIFLPDPSNLANRKLVSLNNYTIYEKKGVKGYRESLLGKESAEQARRRSLGLSGNPSELLPEEIGSADTMLSVREAAKAARNNAPGGGGGGGGAAAPAPAPAPAAPVSCSFWPVAGGGYMCSKCYLIINSDGTGHRSYCTCVGAIPSAAVVAPVTVPSFRGLPSPAELFHAAPPKKREGMYNEGEERGYLPSGMSADDRQKYLAQFVAAVSNGGGKGGRRRKTQRKQRQKRNRRSRKH